MDRHLRTIAAAGLAVGAVLGMAGTFAPTASLRGLAWGIDGIAIVVACALLTMHSFRQGDDIVAAGFLVFAVGEGLIVSTSAMELAASTPSFGAGAGLWAAALALISIPRVFPSLMRGFGLIASGLLAVTALRILAGAPLQPLTAPLPFFAYPFLAATLLGWAWVLMKTKTNDDARPA